MIRHNKNNKT